MNSQISSNSGESERNYDAREYHGVIVSYDYNSGLGVIGYNDEVAPGVAVRRKVGFRREFVLVGLDYALNVGEEVKFGREGNSKAKNIIPVNVEDRVREEFRKKSLEAHTLVSQRLAKLRSRK